MMIRPAIAVVALALLSSAAHAYYIPSFMNELKSLATTALLFKSDCKCDDKAFKVCKELLDDQLVTEDNTGQMEQCMAGCLRGKSAGSQRLVAAVEKCNALPVGQGLEAYRQCSVERTLNGKFCGGQTGGWWNMITSASEMNTAIEKVKLSLSKYATDLESCSKECQTDADVQTMEACKNLFRSCRPDFPEMWKEMQYCVNEHSSGLADYCACMKAEGVDCPWK